MIFDGKKMRDEVLVELTVKVAKMEHKPTLAVFLIGGDPVSAKYDDIKKKFTEKIGAHFCLYKFDEKDSEQEIIAAIEFLNADPETDGVMIQIPIPKKFNRDKLIAKISPAKDVDGLRFCAGLDSKFQPPVVLAILEALKIAESRIKNYELRDLKITLAGHGFLVGAPLARSLRENGSNPLVILNEVKNLKTQRSFADAQDDIKRADIIISATGSPNLIKPEMVKDGVVLIDAGTSEENGELRGDIDPECYGKASYYTPVPGGIGPVTVAMLLRNLTQKSEIRISKSETNSKK
ncbi:MAG: bifunctional 5,10-methylenetetrahydrofolate dehydrogenase/5,10-methenyltetrahydrofolate cyclohydrolase [bacterium]|nr:bifunctional 5,10-methylenetetrahydrofolate dehydrogenase/5,10-methenyltetrahydrofolate cyclohydrolase [bacterium]